jgi:hypothetical protein
MVFRSLINKKKKVDPRANVWEANAVPPSR